MTIPTVDNTEKNDNEEHFLMNSAIRKSKWDETTRLNPSEWPDGALQWIHYRVIDNLIDLRNVTPIGAKMKPSPIFRAHVRHDRPIEPVLFNSMHSTLDKTQLSMATDIYLVKEYMWDVWFKAQRISEIGGIGLYFTHWLGSKNDFVPMIHIDIRPDRLLWVHDEDGYIYSTEPERFFQKIVKNFNNFR